jgi:hypothetical protein
MGKNTPGYAAYVTAVPRLKRDRRRRWLAPDVADKPDAPMPHPVTPDHTAQQVRRFKFNLIRCADVAPGYARSHGTAGS